jgi:peroxiredoxin
MSAPDLCVELADGRSYRLDAAQAERFTMVVFFRGYFCNVCKEYLPSIQEHAPALSRLGVSLVLVSCDSRERSEWIQDEWGISLPLGHTLDLATAQAWSLFLSRGDPARPEMPTVFSEPALYLVDPEHRIFFAALCTAPVGRPRISDMVSWFEFMEARGAYPMRGDYDPSPPMVTPPPVASDE